jgi:hypothetical protein
MADDVAVTAGAGTSIATDDIGGRHFQRVKPAWGPDGTATDVSNDNPLPVVQRGLATYYYSTALAAGATNKIYIDIFNAAGSGKIVKLRGLYVVSNSAAVVGVPINWSLRRTSAVGTGGTTLTAGLADTGDAAVPAQITARHAATGGATDATTLFDFYTTSEETIAANAISGMINWIPVATGLGSPTAREGQGLKLQHVTNSTTGSWLVTAAITLE